MPKETEIREILVQDVKYSDEITRFENLVYRRDETNKGKPLYFAPYFTEDNEDGRAAGISRIAKIFGIKPTTKITWDVKLQKECETWLQGHDAQTHARILGKWKNGIIETVQKEFTYYFLDEPVSLKTPLLKRDWINFQTGKSLNRRTGRNVCVTFADFLKNSDLVP